VDSDFKPFFELLKMHNIFTWDMSSSVYYLTQKMLMDSKNELNIDKYSKINQMIFSELNDGFIKPSSDKHIILDSSGQPIRNVHRIYDKEGCIKEAHIGKQVELLMANLSWLAYRTIFYTIMAKETGGTLILHPIRNSFQINFLRKVYPQSTDVFRQLISSINMPAEKTIKSIFASTQPLITKFSLPMFSIVLTNKAGSPTEAINAAYQLKNEGDFVKARTMLAEIEEFFAEEKPQKAIISANKLVSQVEKLMKRICVRYGIATPQGISLSPIITFYNIGSLLTAGQLPSIPNYSGKIGILDKVKDMIPQKGFNAVYKSLINDLTQISQLGRYHEMLTSKVVYHKDADFYTAKVENEKYMHSKSSWKVPM